MTKGDFYGSEKSTTVPEATDVVVELLGNDGSMTVLKASTPLEADEVIDASCMNVKKLCAFYEQEISEAKETELLLSLVRHARVLWDEFMDPLTNYCFVSI
jgi:isocitrate dehydrogenase